MADFGMTAETGRVDRTDERLKAKARDMIAYHEQKANEAIGIRAALDGWPDEYTELTGIVKSHEGMVKFWQAELERYERGTENIESSNDSS